MTDRGSQFYANASETRGREYPTMREGWSSSGSAMASGIRRQTASLHGEIQRKLPEFEAILMRKSDPVDLFVVQPR